MRCTAACTDKVWSRRNVSVHTVLTYLLFCHADSTNTARCAAACINQVRRWQSVSVRTVLTYLLFCYVDSTNTARCAAACSDKVRSRRGVSVCVALHNLVPTVIVLNVIKYLHSGCTGERQGPNQDWRIRGNHLLLSYVGTNRLFRRSAISTRIRVRVRVRVSVRMWIVWYLDAQRQRGSE